MLNYDLRWFVKEKYNPHAQLRLFCFPYAGGNSSIYRGWQQKLGKEIQVVAIEPPGRAMRFGEIPISQIHQFIKILKKEIIPLLDKPYVFFGHSNGALMSYVLSQELQIHHSILGLQHMIISAKRAPQLASIKENIHELPDEEFIEELRLLDATPNEILDNKEIMLQFLPLLRADFALSSNYTHNSKIKPRVNLSLFGGIHDKDIDEEDIIAWKHTSIGSAKYYPFDGNHFFIHSCKDSVIDTVRKILRTVLLNSHAKNNKNVTTSENVIN